METTHQPLNKTKLQDRTLWFDGDSSYPADDISRSLVRNGAIFVDEITRDIKMYNLYVPPEQQLRVKTECRELTFDWVIPEEFKNINVRQFLIEKLEVESVKFNDAEIAARAVRLHKELKLFEKHALIDVLRVLIYIINTLRNEKVVWGVGRGSSVSSYVLYLIGVHDVDSVEYDLDITDFLH